nr:alpha-amylase domain-containing protein [uncultured Desulfobacter sp.]
MSQINGVMMQHFHWYVSNDGTFWTQVRDSAQALKNYGFSAVWLPPAYKGQAGNEYEIEMVPVPHLARLVELRRSHAHGRQRDQFKYAHMIGWTREGDANIPGSGLAAVFTIAEGGVMWLDVGKTNAHKQYCDALGNMGGATVAVNADGWGAFPASGGSLSVWIPA